MGESKETLIVVTAAKCFAKNATVSTSTRFLDTHLCRIGMAEGTKRSR